MPEQSAVQIGLDPNLYYVTNVNVSANEEEILLLLASGNQARQFALSPKHAKRVLLLLQHSLQDYQKQYGELKTSLPSQTQQPKTTPMGFQTDGATS